MDKTLRNFIIVGIIALSLASIFYFVYLPYKGNYDFNKCLNSSENIYNKKFQEITDHIKDLEKQKEFAQKEADEKFDAFQEENPEPRKENYPITAEELNKPNKTFADYFEIKNGTSKEYRSASSKWDSEKNEIFKNVDRIKKLTNLINSDFEKIEKEKEESASTCYKKYK